MASDYFSIPLAAEIQAHGNLDVLGIHPGMAASDAEKILEEHTGNQGFRVMTTRIGTRDVSSESFPVVFYSWPENDQITVHLTSPSVGNAVYAVSRRLSMYRDQRPRIDDLASSLIAKYGEPANVSESGRSRTLTWYVGGEGSCSMRHLNVGMARYDGLCTSPWHITGPSINNQTYNPGKSEHYTNLLTGGSEVIVAASINWYEDDGRASAVTMSVLDLNRRAVAAQHDVALINEHQKAYDQIEVEVPRL